MNFRRFLLERIFSRLRIKGALRFLYALEKIGHPSEVAFPMELLPSGVKMHLRGFMTFHSVQINLDLVWPYWIRKQFDPTSRSFIPRAMNLTHVNQTHRNWTAVGSLGGTVEPIVDPAGLLTPWFDGWSLDFWLYRNGRLIAPSRIDGVEQSLRERLPIVVTSFTQEGLHVRMEVWGDTIDGHDVVIERVRLQNLLEETIEGRGYFSIRPYNPEGMSLIRHLFYRDDGVWEVNRTVGVLLPEKPARVNCSDQRLGDVSIILPDTLECGRLDCEAGMATALSEYDLSLAPGEIREYTAVCTTKADKPYEALVRAVQHAPNALRPEQMIQRWKGLLDRGMSVSLPDPILEECFDANKAFLHLFDDGDEITPGPLTYHRFWFRDAAFMIHALDKLGYAEAARQKLKTYPGRQRKDGYFISQNGEWDSNGQAVWTLMESYRLSPDPDFLREVYGAIRRAVFWIARKRRKTRHADGPERGLLPPGFSAEHFGPNDYYYWDDFWSLAGIRDGIEAARILGEARDHRRFQEIYQAFWADVNRSLDQVAARLSQRILPASPFRRMDAGAIGSISALYPLRLLRADDERVVNTVRYLHAHSFFEDGFFQNVVHSGVNPYLTAQIAQCYLYRRSREAWPLIYYLLKIATSTYTWPEAVHPLTGGGCMGDGHHGWAAAEIVLLVRNLLLFEEDDTLVLTPILPREWVWEGARIEVTRAPTYFGPVDFRIDVRGDEMELNLQPRFRSKPERLEWHLPFEIETAEADAGPVEVRQNVLLLQPDARQVAVRTRSHRAVS
jgi:hypothetical protein